MKICHYCHTEGDLRPYGPDGAGVCRPCAFATPEREAQTCASLKASLTKIDGFALLTPDGPVQASPEAILALGNYMPDVLDLAVAKGAGVHTIDIRHDDNCALLAANGPCNCNPDVSMSGAS